MSPLQQQKFQHLINTGRHAAARTFLDELVRQGDADAQALRADMDITYPVTKSEKAIQGVNRLALYILFAVLALVVIGVSIGVIQLIQAQMALRS